MSNIIRFPTNLIDKHCEDEMADNEVNSSTDSRDPVEEYHQFRQLLVSELVQLRKDVGKA